MTTKTAKGWTTVADAARWLDITVQAVHQSYIPMLAADDIDRASKPMRLRTAALIALAADRQTTGQHLDAALLAGDSPALERYRLARAQIAELELAQRKNDLIDREAARAVFGRWAAIIRRTGDQLNKRHGNEAGKLLADALADCRTVVNPLSPAD